MSIFYDQSGQPSEVFANLYTISMQDGHLGDIPVPGDPTAQQVTYDGAAPAPATAARLHALVNNNFAPIVIQTIVITALNGGTDPYSGENITGNGLTYTDVVPGVGTIIRIVYDVSQCNGAGIALFDTDGNPISTPNPVILYHELSHAFHGAMNQIPFDTTLCSNDTTSDEPAATVDENVMRGVLGYCLRDVCNHDGTCGSGDNCSGPPVTPGCFIVSVTTGSSKSAEVNRLRQLRDGIKAISGLGAQLIDVIYDEYYQFSPGIAAELEQDAFARQAVLWVVVRPLLAWYTLAGTLALEQADEEAINQAVQDVLSACPRHLGGSVVALLEAIRSGESLPADAPQLLLDFAPRIQEAARFRCASWAILDPLTRAWRSADSGLDVVEEVSQWLTTAPLEVLAPPSDPQMLDMELGVLASFFNFKPMARQQLGERLAAAWPDVASVLERYSFV
jgi:hypothetical protein